MESFPLPSTIEWTLNGHRLVDDANLVISMQGDSHAVVNTRLRVHQVQPRHFGVYACAAVNKLGFAQSEVRLLESQTPVCPPACGSLYSAAPAPAGWRRWPAAGWLLLVALLARPLARFGLL